MIFRAQGQQTRATAIEGLDIVGAKRDVTAIERIETLFGPESNAEILRRDVNPVVPSVRNSTLRS
jgi:hypothetical protein